MNITSLYGTETGNAEMLAEDIAGELESGHEVNVANLSDFDPAGFDQGRFYLMVCSTYGDGELLGSAQPFAKAMAASLWFFTSALFRPRTPAKKRRFSATVSIG